MSADDESTPAAAETMAPESQSHKRKASQDIRASEASASPKRTKLDGEELGNGRLVASEDAQKPRHPSSPKQDDHSGHQQQDRSIPDDSRPRAHRDSESRPSRRPSIPLHEPRQAPGPGGRNRVSNEEKKRGQRLFGGLLGTLSRKTDTSQQQKRQEIERRQQERAQAQKAEDDKRRAEKLAKLTHVRKIEQVKFDEQVMHTRHTNVLALAKSLSTRSEPKISYLPWKLTESQESLIREQVRAARDLVARETEEFAHQKLQRLEELGVTISEPEPRTDTANSGAPPPDRPPSSASGPERRPSSTAGHDKDHDDAGYVMVEADEDTVIY